MRYKFTFFALGRQIIFGLAVLFAWSAEGQSLVPGKVLNREDGKPLPGAIVNNLTRKTGTIASDSGTFALEMSPKDSLLCTYMSFVPWAFSYDGRVPLTIVLDPGNDFLEEVVISATKSDQALKNTSVSMEVIRPYIIQNKNPATLENTVDQIPGVQTVNGQVVIRSSSGWSYGAGSRVTVMLDGMPMLSGDAGQVQWSFLPLENVESMEVIKGASSVLFGSSALSGVINIRSRKPGLEPETRVSLFHGFYNKPSSPDLDWNNGKLLQTYGLRASHSRRFGKNSVTVTMNTFDDDGYRMSDVDNRMRLGLQYQRDLKKISGYFSLNSNLQQGRSSSFLLWESYQKGYTALDSSFTKNRTFRFNIDPTFVSNRNGWRHLVQGRFLKIENEILDVSNNNSQSNYSNMMYGEYQVARTFFSRYKVTGGAVYNWAKSESPLYQGDHEAQNMAAYLQLTTLIGLWNLDAGMRYEHYKLDKYSEAKPVFRAGLSRELTRATFLRASFGQGYRFPTIAESFILTSVGPVKIYPNQDLRSETGWNTEIGLKQGVRAGKMSGLLDVAFFLMEYQRMMEFTFAQWENPTLTNPGLGFKSLNVADARIAGIDFSFAGTRSVGKAQVKWLGGYTYTNAITLDPDKVIEKTNSGSELSFTNTSSDPRGNFLKYRPKHLARLDIQGDLKTWEAGLSLRYNSYLKNIDKAFVSWPISAMVPGIQDARDAGKQGDYIIDLRLGKSYKNYKVMFLINNLLNRKYMTRPADLRPPRSFMVQFNVSLG